MKWNSAKKGGSDVAMGRGHDVQTFLIIKNHIFIYIFVLKLIYVFVRVWFGVEYCSTHPSKKKVIAMDSFLYRINDGGQRSLTCFTVVPHRSIADVQ